MNTVIIGIIVLVVLIVIIAFFTGGTGTVINKIKGIATATDYESAVKTCNSYESAALDLEYVEGELGWAKNSAYCKKSFKLDLDKDGNMDVDSNGKEFNFYCEQILGTKSEIPKEACKGVTKKTPTGSL